ncbi:MAG: putative ATP-binding protein phnN, partial [Ramlibacter sp.]|uniref:AAA family ATPase n=1 Tax=Ramlibacter sp. TaxID=1917967 RepID=UPI00262B58E5
MTGCWVIVCGPSGAGKDSVIGWAQAALARHPRVRFARRLVTREAHPASDHEPVSAGEMQALRARGALAWHWEAHGCAYGVPQACADAVADGKVVVVNGSRAHALSLADCDNVRCVLVTAPDPLLRQRLQAR